MKTVEKLIDVIVGAGLIAYAAWYFGAEFGLDKGQIIHLGFAIYFVCIGQICLAKSHEKDDDE